MWGSQNWMSVDNNWNGNKMKALNSTVNVWEGDKRTGETVSERWHQKITRNLLYLTAPVCIWCAGWTRWEIPFITQLDAFVVTVSNCCSCTQQPASDTASHASWNGNGKIERMLQLQQLPLIARCLREHLWFCSRQHHQLQQPAIVVTIVGWESLSTLNLIVFRTEWMRATTGMEFS